MLKFLVLSDLHLVDDTETSHGLDTHMRMERAVDWINTRHADADFCVLAGDLADIGFKGAVRPYERLKALVERLAVPCHITIGNHDSRDIFLSVFGEAMRAETGCIDRVIDAKGYRVILLDSVVEGDEHSHGGQLSCAQLACLEARLSALHATPACALHATPAWKGLRLAAKRRDGWRCIRCGSRVGLEVDHIETVEARPDLALTLGNLQTLCCACHLDKTKAERAAVL